MKNKAILMVTVAVLAIIDIIILTQVLPTLYQNIPLPLPETSKPIGGALFSVTSLYLTLIASNIIIIIIILKKSGYEGKSIPKKNNEWFDLIALLVLGTCGIVMWFYPFFLLFTIAAGAYLLFSEMR
ncbi:hypothetical protein [[Eubacterium] cellulosolvens]